MEIVPAAIVTAVALLALSSVGGAVVTAVANGNVGATVALLQATGWAEPTLAVALLGSALLSWNETRGWCDDLEFYTTPDDDSRTYDVDPIELLRRIRRSRLLATSAFVLSIVTTAASIAAAVAAVTEYPASFDGQRWGLLIRDSGLALGVGVLSLACLFVVMQTRGHAKASLARRANEPVTESDSRDRASIREEP